MDYLLEMTPDQLRDELEDMTADEIEAVIIFLDNQEAKRVLRVAATQVYDQKAAERDAERIVGTLTDQQKKALTIHLNGIENSAKPGDV